MVSVPERVGPAFAAAVKFTEPFPEPVAPDVIVSHGALLADVQLQPLPAVTLTLPDPPAPGASWLCADSPYVQPVP
jgi:hypothetical protein